MIRSLARSLARPDVVSEGILDELA